ncbi:sugar ABC transporter permease [Streptomyces sp. NPDC054841]
MNGGHDWADPALEAVLARVARTRAETGDRFPLHADPTSARWTTTARGSWTGGFWAGLLWLRALHTGTPADTTAAQECTLRLEPWLTSDTATRGLILWYGTALAPPPATAGSEAQAGANSPSPNGPSPNASSPDGPSPNSPLPTSRTHGRTHHPGSDSAAEPPPGADPRRPGGTPGGHAHVLRRRGAAALLQDFDRELGLVPWGEAFGGPRLRARADAVPGVVQLLACAGPEGRAAAASHLGRHLDLCNQSPYSAWEFSPQEEAWSPLPEPAPGWSRGRAWLLLAAADGLWHLGGTACHPALARLVAAAVDPSAPLVPPADSARPDGPLDTSAAAITAVALLKLADKPYEPYAPAWSAGSAGSADEPYAPAARQLLKSRAADILRRLATVHTTTDGRLLDGCYDAGGGAADGTADGIAVRHELVWGSFFFAYGLAALTGLVDVHAA